MRSNTSVGTAFRTVYERERASGMGARGGIECCKLTRCPRWSHRPGRGPPQRFGFGACERRMLRAKGMRVARTVRSYELNWAAWLRMPSWVFGLPPGGTPDAGHTQCECTHSDVRRRDEDDEGIQGARLLTEPSSWVLSCVTCLKKLERALERAFSTGLAPCALSYTRSRCSRSLCACSYARVPQATSSYALSPAAPSSPTRFSSLSPSLP